MQRFAELMERELALRGHKVRLLRPAPRLNRSGSAPLGIAKWLGYLDKLILFPLLLKRVARRFDVVHICDHSNSFYLPSIQNKPHVITCHDVIAIRSALELESNSSTGWSGKALQKMILGGLNQAATVACVSMNTRRELLEVSKLKPHSAVVIYQGINYPYSPMPHQEAMATLSSLGKERAIENLDSTPFIFHVGGNQWYKNRLGVLRIYQELRTLPKGSILPRLIMAGKPFDEEMRKFVNQHHLTEWVVEIPNCSNEQLRAFYSSARVMLFPSLAEGFGWPVIEAQACGCPVLTSNFAPLTEIGGEAAIFCDPKDEREVARQLDALLSESEKDRDARVHGGLSNAKRFSPQKMIDSYLELYRTAMTGRSAA